MVLYVCVTAEELKQEPAWVWLLNEAHFWAGGQSSWSSMGAQHIPQALGARRGRDSAAGTEQSPAASAPGSHQLPYVTLLCICLERPATGAVPHKGAGAGAPQAARPPRSRVPAFGHGPGPGPGPAGCSAICRPGSRSGARLSPSPQPGKEQAGRCGCRTRSERTDRAPS